MLEWIHNTAFVLDVQQQWLDFGQCRDDSLGKKNSYQASFREEGHLSEASGTPEMGIEQKQNR